jgi:hypothetical protein
MQGLNIASAYIIGNTNKKVGVFEIEKKAQINTNTDNQQRFSSGLGRGAVNPVRQIEIDNSRKDNEQKIKAAGFVKEIHGKNSEQNHPGKLTAVDKLVEKQKGAEKK